MFINVVHMSIEWLWKYEYFVNMRQMACSAKNINTIYLCYGNMFLTTTDKLIFFLSTTTPTRGCLIYFTPPYQRIHDQFHPPH